MYDKTKIFNLALSALFIQKRVVNADTDKSTEALTLNVNWDTAFEAAISDMDLDSFSSTRTLELVTENPNEFWKYAYKYPSDCAFMRRIVSSEVMDNRETRIDTKIEVIGGVKVILTNAYQASIEYLPNNLTLSIMSAEAALYIALKLASLAVPLIVGKNSKIVSESLNQRITAALFNAQKKDAAESSVYQSEENTSEWVRARIS